MSIEITIPPSLQSLVKNEKQVSVSGATVGECLEVLMGKYPELKPAIFPRGWKVSKKLSIYVNGENAHPLGLAKAVKDGDKLYIMDILVGG
jgi:molybdopterin converting factor small subunit